MTEINKTILLIGRSGRGKSTLANVVTGSNKFEESSGSASKTKKIQFEQFLEESSNTKYLIIDTPGIGDTKMSDKEVLSIIAEAVYRTKDGVNQVFFVIDKRFDQNEMATYNILRKIIFDQEITKHTTIVRTNFTNFNKPKKCQADIDLMIKEAEEKKSELENKITDHEKQLEKFSVNSKEYKTLLLEIEKLRKELTITNLAEVIESCQRKVVHVDNPSLNIVPDDDEDSEEEEKRIEKEIVDGKKTRNKSRKKLLEHLKNSCLENYNPPNLKKLSNEIAEDYFQYLKKKEELQEELERLKPKKNSNFQISSSSSKNKNKIESGSEIKIKEEKEELVEDNQEANKTDDDDLAIGERITRLESKKARLNREIAEKEEIIRGKVLKHIFNNYDGITEEVGGDIFLDNIIDDKNDWGNIEKSFADKKLILEWKSKGFDYEQVQKWAIVLERKFDPKKDIGFCVWLRDDKKLTVENIKELSHVFNIESLRKEYAGQLEKEIGLLGKHNSQLSKEKYNPSIIIKFLENLSLYSGDVITLNNSEPLLVEVIDSEKVKLRRVDSNGYLYKTKNSVRKSFEPLRFSSNSKKFSLFVLKKNDQDKMSLEIDGKYLYFEDGRPNLSSEEKWLSVAKEINVKGIVNFKEEILEINKGEPRKENEEEETIAHHFYDNKSNTTSKQIFEFNETFQEEHNLTSSSDFTWGTSTGFKAEICSAFEIEIGGQFEFEITKETSNSVTTTKSKNFTKNHEIDFRPWKNTVVKLGKISNSFNTTKLKVFEKSVDIDCEPWKRTVVKLMAKKVKVITPYNVIVERTIGNNTYEYPIEGEYVQNSYIGENIFHYATDTRNILLVGWTGSGKSTLANVLSNSKDFTESNQSTSETKFFQKSEEFEWKDNYYCIIDNIGFGDSNEVKEDTVLFRIGEAINSAHQGLSHVLLVFDGKFSDKVKEDFGKLGALKITNSLITIVRTRFENFGNKKACERDKKALEKESSELSDLLTSCRELLHIDNSDEESRSKSRRKVLDYLHNKCKDEDPFKPKEWEDIASLIDNYFKEKARLVNEIKENADGKTEIIRQIDNLKTDATNQVKEKINQGEEINEFVQLIETSMKK